MVLQTLRGLGPVRLARTLRYGLSLPRPIRLVWSIPASTSTHTRPLMGFASVYPLVTARAVAREVTYEVDDGVGIGAIVRILFGRSRARGIVVARVDEAPTGFDVRPVEAVIGEIPPALVELALWIADYYGSTPARARGVVAPEAAKRRKEQAPPAEPQALAGETQPAQLSAAQAHAGARVGGRLEPG